MRSERALKTYFQEEGVPETLHGIFGTNQTKMSKVINSTPMDDHMRPILYDFPMPIGTPLLILRPPQLSDGTAVNEAISKSFETL